MIVWEARYRCYTTVYVVVNLPLTDGYSGLIVFQTPRKDKSDLCLLGQNQATVFKKNVNAETPVLAMKTIIKINK